jgi:hypothetical protein
LRQPAPELELGAEQGVWASVRAHEHEAANELGVAKRELLRDRASHREACDVDCGRVQRVQERGRVVGHGRRRQCPVGQRRASDAPVVEGGQAVAVGQPVELVLPRLGGVAEPGDQQHVGPVAAALDPELELANADGCGGGHLRCSLS